MRTEKIRIVAWLVALLANALFLLYLASTHRQAEAPEAPLQGRVQLYFISPPKPEVAAAPMPLKPALEAVERRRSPRRDASKAVTVAENHHGPTPAESHPAEMRDDWFAAPAPQPHTARPNESFAPDPLRPRAQRMEATTNRMTLDFRDSSLGGRLRSISQAGICKELRAQLASNPASAQAILASMSRHGCIKG